MAKFSIPELKTLVATLVTASNASYGSFTATRDNVVGLLDKIGKIITLDTEFQIDKLARFDGSELTFGKTVEDWAQDLILPGAYDASGSGALSPSDPTYRPVHYSYTIGRKVIKTTVRNDNIERAVHFDAQAVDIISMIYKRISDSRAQYRYGLKKELLATLIGLCWDEMGMNTAPATFSALSNYATVNTLLKDNNTPTAWGILVKPYSSGDAANWAGAVAAGYIVVLDLVTKIAKPVDTSTGDAFIKQLKADIEIARDVSEGHSLNGNTLGATDGLVLITKQGVIPTLEVDTYAGAFNRNDLAVPCDIIVVNDFGSANAKNFAVLMDARGMRLFNDYSAIRENFNGDGDFLNLFDHSEFTPYACRNTFVKVYRES